MGPGSPPPPPCPLCGADRVRPFAAAHGRCFLSCDVCALIHLTPDQRPDPVAELAHYRTHENDPADPGYRAFLGRLAEPLAARLPPGATGLDFGAGPGPTLSVMMEEMGFRTALYDPYFAPDPGALDRTYDFITCSETAEHFAHPGAELERLHRMLMPGGWLALMTTIFRDQIPFERWHYARDPTHVCFYRPQTMAWIAQRFSLRAEHPHPNVVLFRKADG